MPSLRALALAACLACSVRAASAETLRVFAAASLTEAFRDLGAAFERAHPGDRVELNFGGSQILRTQIEQGAPADVFASADQADTEPLQRAGLLGPTQVFARNSLVVVVPAGQVRVRQLQDLAQPGVKLVVAAATVPVGRYTAQVLGRLAAAGLYGDDFQSRVQANVVSLEPSVRAVLAKVALGEADAGLVYVTDAITSDRVRSIAIPDRYNAIAEYPIGVVTKAARPALARAFVAFVQGAVGHAALRKHGFAVR